MRCVRIWFAKEGKVKYISHLDVMRCMSRAVRRARLPLWYTEGFNPHPYMMFALPLSLGFSSQCESMDIRIEGEMTDADIAGRMRDVMPEGLRLLSVREPVMQPSEIALRITGPSSALTPRNWRRAFSMVRARPWQGRA